MSKGIEDFVITGIDMSADSQSYPALYKAVSRLSAKAKQAMYQAASARKIAQGTWDGCAFNAGGIEIGNSGVTSFQTAATAFGCSLKTVQAFIGAWDNLRADDPTGILRETLESVGLFDEPTRAFKIVRTVEWESEQTKLVNAFKAQMEDPEFAVDGLAEAKELLGVA